MKTRRQITDFVKEMRQRQTPQEALLWEQLRRRALGGYKFYRQHAIVYSNIDKQIQFFVADFYCANPRLVIEVDGKVHDTQQEYDGYREDILRDMGFTILRIKNEELNDMETVLIKIQNTINRLVTP